MRSQATVSTTMPTVLSMTFAAGTLVRTTMIRTMPARTITAPTWPALSRRDRTTPSVLRDGRPGDGHADSFLWLGAWTSTVIFNSYKYATDNGAKIISTSYNIDSFAADPTFASALDYAYTRGVLHFNSAGNNSQLNPPRQAFDQLVFVASTESNDAKSSFSNYGYGTDISAPGGAIYATLPGDTYGTMSGTSMSTPNAAAVAALIWSAHPTWTRDQVAAQIMGTADNIDAVNPSYAGNLGSGRANAFRAVTESIVAPRFKGLLKFRPTA